METSTKLITTISILLLIAAGINVLPDDNYYCEVRELPYHCDSLSSYYGLSNGKCINDISTNKLCRSGWFEIDRNKNETNSEVVGIKLNKDDVYLVCQSIGNRLSECQMLDSNKIIYKYD